MKTHTIANACATVELSLDELRILNNSLNEVCNGLDFPEFTTRMGATLPEVQQLLEEINTLASNPLLQQAPLP